MPRIPAPAPAATGSTPPVWWLPLLVVRLGLPETDPGLDRWTWQDGELGVYIEHLTHAWQTAVWARTRSVTLRSLERPCDADLMAVVKLVGLDREPGTAS